MTRHGSRIAVVLGYEHVCRNHTAGGPHNDWCIWLERHGFDANDVLVMYPIIIDDIDRTVTVQGRGGLVTNQLEAPALELPHV